MDFYGLRVGETPFYQEDKLRARLASRRGTPNVWIKDEADNPGNMHKARVAACEILRCVNGYSPDVPLILTKTTAGDIAEAVGYLAKFTPRNIQFASVVDKSTPKSTRKRLGHYGPVVTTDLYSKELAASEVAEIVRKRTRQKNAVVVPIGGMDTDWSGCKSIARELYDQGVKSDYRIFVPVGGGDTLANIRLGFKELGEMPKFVGATVPGNVFSDAPYDGRGLETKLHARYSGFKHELVKVKEDYEFQIRTVSHDEREEELEFLRREVGIRAGPSAATAFAAAYKYAQDPEFGFEDGENVVILNTGLELPPATSRVPRGAKRFMMIGGIAALLTAGLQGYRVWENIKVNEAKINRSVSEYWEKERRELAGNPTKAEIGAFALYRGRTERLSNGRLVNVPNDQVVNTLESWYLYNDLVARDMYKKTGSEFRKTIDEFQEWRRLNRVINSPERTPEDMEYFRRQLEAAIVHKTDGGPDARLPESGRFMLDYLDRDPYLNDKIAFALSRTQGRMNQEFVQIIADLHYPGYGNLESMICRDTPRCVETHRKFDSWKEQQKQNWDKMVSRK